jgi:asparagine synthase (glutamine-hydrolysing)
MCGITGIYAFNEVGRWGMVNLRAANDALAHRGPDAARLFDEGRCGLGHRRLAIIDLSPDGNQPMTDASGRYTIVFNGEIYNYQALRAELQTAGVEFQSASDTEVLLYLYIRHGQDALARLHGFFAFAVYDARDETLFVARDRLGIKPLLWYADEDKFLFASELDSLLAYNIPKTVDWASVYQYFHLHYVPAPHSMLRGVFKLPQGHWLRVQGRDLQVGQWYAPPRPTGTYAGAPTYEAAQRQLVDLMEASVQERLIADVPLGTFLSGGIDSSVVTALASRHKPDLNTFSIGYADEPFFDETRYANLVAKKYQTNHTVFSLRNDDLFEAMGAVMGHFGEPFADSSCLPFYILSQRTRQRVTVALSGDGADELFAGYNKYLGEYRARAGGLVAQLLRAALPMLEWLPRSRNSALGNKLRQAHRFAESLALAPAERYWYLSGFVGEARLAQVLAQGVAQRLAAPSPLDPDNEWLPALLHTLEQDYPTRKAQLLRPIQGQDLNEVLYADVQMVLTNDMLTKVDLMSMAHALEVRVPFLDHRVVNFAFSLPAAYKIDGKMKKRLVQDAFRHLLPPELYNRPKHGFDVPLAKGYRTEWRKLIERDLLADDFVAAQGVFSPAYIKQLKHAVFNTQNFDQNHVWAILVFQHWWKRLGLAVG